MSILDQANEIVWRAYVVEAPLAWYRRVAYDLRGQWARLSPTEQQALLAYAALFLATVLEQLMKLLIARAGTR